MSRVLLVRDCGISAFFTLSGIGSSIVKVFETDNGNTVAIDETFTYDITPNFPKYIAGLYPLLERPRKERFRVVSAYNMRMIYGKPVNGDIINDITILLRKDNYDKASIPYASNNGGIKIVIMDMKEAKHNTLDPSSMINEYRKIRTTVFNTTILPYVRSICL